MKNQNGYGGLDRFRILAALMVVAIHTSPLLCFGQLPDFIFTRVLCRLGVPFFLAATGFFVLGRYAAARRAPTAPLGRFVRKTAIVYGVAILLYLPVNLYAGHFKGQPVAGLLRMLFIDGTMYHLWYLPAVIFGVVLVWLMLRFWGLPVATAVAAGLYVAGLLGDSYHGLAAGAPVLKAFYDGLFTVSEYTRNGLFYAPAFLLVGVWATRRPAPARGGAVAAGFWLALAGLVAEGLLLNGAALQKHDSMYLLLPLCLFFLFRWLLTFGGAPGKLLRGLSLVVYVIHPMVIVLVRGAAKAAGLTWLLVENSLVHYLVVCLLSFGAGLVLCWLGGRFLPGARGRKTTPKRAWVEVDMAALRQNLRLLRGLVPAGCRLMPAVKADGYGFGAVAVARQLQGQGVDAFCVASLEEGMALRAHGIKGEILVLGYTPPEKAPLLRRHRLAQTVVDAAHAAALNATGMPLKVHLKVDTGMCRLGQWAGDTPAVLGMFRHKNLRVEGLFTQLAAADSRRPEAIASTRRQMERFWALCARLKAAGIALPPVHLQCSYGILNHPMAGCAYARPGLAVYGIVDEALCVEAPPPLRPVYTMKCRVAQVKKVPAGAHIGYGQGFTAPAAVTLAVITAGYGDGLPRALSDGVGQVLVGGRHAPVVGKVCMDQAIIDVSAAGPVAPGDEVVLIGRQGGAEITIHQFARWAHTLPNEVASRLGRRVERVYQNERPARGKRAAGSVRAFHKKAGGEGGRELKSWA